MLTKKMHLKEALYIKGLSKNPPLPLQWRGIKGEAKQ